VDISGPSITPTASYHVPRLNPYLPTLGSCRATSVSGMIASTVVPDKGKGLCSDFESSGLNSLDPCFVFSSRTLPDNPTFHLSPPTKFMGPFPPYTFCPSIISDCPSVAFLPGPFYPFPNPPPPAHALSHPSLKSAPRSKPKISVSSQVRARPCSSSSPVGPACGLVSSTVSGGAPVVSGQKRVFGTDLLSLPQSRTAVYFGQKGEPGPEAAELPSPPQKKRFSPPASSPLSLQDHMDLAAISLTALRNSAPAPVSVGLPSTLDVSVACSVASTCLVARPLAPISVPPVGIVSPLTSLATSVGVTSSTMVSTVASRKVLQVARKARSATHFVSLADSNLGAGSVTVRTTSEAAGSSMPPQVP
jgi:hypothetical protein